MIPTARDLSMAHPRDSRIAAAEKPHIYFLDGSCDQVVSVSTLYGAFFEPFDSEAVARRCTESATWQTRHRPSNKYYGCNTWQDIARDWSDRADLGTNLHACIEDYLNEVKEPRPVHPKNEVCFQQWVQWWESIASPRFELERMERAVFDEEARVAGRIDFYGHVKGYPDRKVIIDWKRCDGIVGKFFPNTKTGLAICSHLNDTKFIKYSIQQALYQAILQRKYGERVERCFLLQLHPSLDEPELMLTVPLVGLAHRMLDVMTHYVRRWKEAGLIRI